MFFPPPKTALSATHYGAGSAGGRDFPLGAGQPADLVEDAMQWTLLTSLPRGMRFCCDLHDKVRSSPLGCFFLCWSRSIVSFGIVHGHGWVKVCTSENWTDPELWRRGISVITVYVLVSPVARLRFPRIFQHTPSTYPRPSSNSLWRISFSFGGLGMPGVCFRCMLGFS